VALEGFCDGVAVDFGVDFGVGVGVDFRVGVAVGFGVAQLFPWAHLWE
jgi:hypothetical protein